MAAPRCIHDQVAMIPTPIEYMYPIGGASTLYMMELPKAVNKNKIKSPGRMVALYILTLSAPLDLSLRQTGPEKSQVFTSLFGQDLSCRSVYIVSSMAGLIESCVIMRAL